MDTRKPSSTSEMRVTSIRLEAQLKERLRGLSGEQGYQSLIREILWQFVEQCTVNTELQSHSIGLGRSPSQTLLLSRSEIRVTFDAIAQREEHCALTGQLIRPQQPMKLGLTLAGELVPLSA